MKIDAMMPKWDFTNETPYYTAVIWQTDQNGLSHHCSTNHGQSDHLVVLPEFIAKKWSSNNSPFAISIPLSFIIYALGFI